MARVTLKRGDRVFAVLRWDEELGAAVLDPSPLAVEQGLVEAFAEPVNAYDPRDGAIRIVNPQEDKYSMYIWGLQWVQDARREGVESEIGSTGIDFSEVVPPSEPGTVT
jgi:hypothetical protein